MQIQSNRSNNMFVGQLKVNDDDFNDYEGDPMFHPDNLDSKGEPMGYE